MPIGIQGFADIRERRIPLSYDRNRDRISEFKCFLVVFCFVFLYGCTMDSDGGTEFSITASSPSPDSIYIKWETEAKIQSYKIFRQSVDTGDYGYLAAINNDNSYLDTGLQASTKYRYKIAYTDSGNASGLSEAIFLP